ncbi:hypothetical protein E4T56_gene9391, partial [Termitomyces sp. T112]
CHHASVPELHDIEGSDLRGCGIGQGDAGSTGQARPQLGKAGVHVQHLLGHRCRLAEDAPTDFIDGFAGATNREQVGNRGMAFAPVFIGQGGLFRGAGKAAVGGGNIAVACGQIGGSVIAHRAGPEQLGAVLAVERVGGHIGKGRGPGQRAGDTLSHTLPAAAPAVIAVAGVEGGAIRFGQRRAAAEAFDQIGIGDIEIAEGHRLGLILRQQAARLVQIEPGILDHRARPMRAHQIQRVKTLTGDMDQMAIGQPQPIDRLKQRAIGFRRIGIGHAVECHTGTYAKAHAPRPDRLAQRLQTFHHKADAALHRSAIGIAALVAVAG